MENSKSTAFHIVTTFGTKIIILFGSFIVSIILARILGPEGKGIVTAVFVVPNLIISLADLGIKQATAFYIGKKIYPFQDIFSSLLIMWLATSSLALAVVFVYYLTGPNELYGWSLLIIALITIPINLLNNYISGILLGKERISAINLNGLISFLVNLISVILFVWVLKLGVHGAAITQIIVAGFLLYHGFTIVRKYVHFRFKAISPIPLLLFKKGIGYALALFILNLNYKIDIIFLERFTSANDVGVFSVGVSLGELIWQLPAAIGMVLFSKSANSKTKEDAIFRSTRLLRITWIPLSIICLVFWTFAPFIVSYLYGNSYIEAVSVIRWLLPGILMMVLFKILNADLAGRGYPLFALRVYIITLIINILLNLFLIPKLGIDGAAIASSISYTFGAILFGIVYSRQNNIKFSTLFFLNREDIKLLNSLLKNTLKKLGNS